MNKCIKIIIFSFVISIFFWVIFEFMVKEYETWQYMLASSLVSLIFGIILTEREEKHE